MDEVGRPPPGTAGVTLVEIVRASPQDTRVLTRIAGRTASTHVQNIIEKLGVVDRRQAAERATGFGIASQSS